jgi:hypothetical protein
MYPRIHWEMVADPLGSAEHTLRTAAIDFKSLQYVTCCVTECPVQGRSKCQRVTAYFVSSQQEGRCRIICVLLCCIAYICAIVVTWKSVTEPYSGCISVQTHKLPPHAQLAASSTRASSQAGCFRLESVTRVDVRKCVVSLRTNSCFSLLCSIGW